MTNVRHRKPAKVNRKSSKSISKAGPKTRFWLIFFIVILFVGIIFYLYYSAADRKPSPTSAEPAVAAPVVTKPTEQRSSTLQAKPKTPVSARSSDLASPGVHDVLQAIHYEAEAQPELQYACSSQLIDHQAYRLSYNATYKVPNWVFYELTIGELLGSEQRTDRFMADPAVRLSESATLADYRKSGYDRGHIAPAADFKFAKSAMSESFYLTNMCPQVASFNRGIWSDLEAQVRDWAERDSAICIASGPVLPQAGSSDYATIGQNHVLVPRYFYKVILSPFGKKPKAIGFVMPNEKCSKRVSDYAVSVDSVERLTRIDFFSVLPDSIEDQVEKAYVYSDWFGR